MAECLDDNPVYNLRAKTKREIKERLKTFEEGTYGEARKVTVNYRDGFDLMIECMTEDRGYWEA
jgi:hypothetical protein